MVVNDFFTKSGVNMFSKRMKNLVPYVPGEQPQDRTYIKLNTNENPYPPSPAIDNLLKSFPLDRLRLYPDPMFTTLRQTIADQFGLTPDQVFVGNGSDEVLAFSFYAFFDSDRGPLLFPEFTYSFYPVYCDLLDIEYAKVPLLPDYGVDLQAFINDRVSCGVIFPNPNAPTGMVTALDDIRSFLDAYSKDRTVVVDEAYIDFGGESCVSLIDDYDNLVVVRTLSKSMALAGIRIGYAMGNPSLIKALFTVKDSFNSYPANMLSQEIARLAFTDVDYFNEVVARVVSTRKRVSEKMIGMGWEVLPSSANFVFARKQGVAGKEIYLRLKERGILVRHFNIQGIDDFVRITIGTDEDMTTLLTEINRCF